MTKLFITGTFSSSNLNNIVLKSKTNIKIKPEFMIAYLPFTYLLRHKLPNILNQKTTVLNSLKRRIAHEGNWVKKTIMPVIHYYQFISRN